MQRFAGMLGALALLGSIGVGAVSADPINDNSRYVFGADCQGQSVDFVTMRGSAAQVLGSTAVLVLQGARVNGVWTLPLSNGAAKQDLTRCTYTGSSGAFIEIWVNLSGS